MKKSFYQIKLAALAMLLLSFASCQNDFDSASEKEVNSSSDLLMSRPKLDITFYALQRGSILHKLNTDDPGKIIKAITITGLQADEKILAIDFRPATGQLYGVGSTSRLYAINLNSGAATMIGMEPFTPALEGNLTGFDFNPTVDRIRIVTNTGQNLRLNPENGKVAMEDADINGASGAMIAAVAYTNSMAGAATTTLYDIDVSKQKLYKQDPPNDGKLVEVGDLGLKISGEGGFDIVAKGNKALALFNVEDKSTLFTVDLKNGHTQVLGRYAKSRQYTGIAIPTPPVAYAVSLMNDLLIFNPKDPASIISKPITGLQADEKVLGLDFRPKNGQLYALGSTSRIYTVNAASGAVMEVGKLTTRLSGSVFGFDFNPVADRIRIVSSNEQNLRVNPDDATATVDGNINADTKNLAVTAAAYTNNFAGTMTTELFVLNSAENKLYQQNPPNEGTLMLRGNLGINENGVNGFDIGGTSGMAYALLTTKDGKTKLYRINLARGAATPVANFSSTVRGFTLGLGF
ncbi:hypothetical protein AHMF7605_22810 [Adhaeribacter arboris]|uniref:DUF4394 domain-containing protein n=1 Tax=Adhaeribacter arboris TaxID=2072846 RepID=A0A2T2YKV1_9BACT|nr:DUF4394 domain-containing protein [Adhaeribacter arboris]PSR56131.1 hypothetical protein AHMF7605_22810 [Adhaeribacter arboris]